jgi:hypothetical protein
LFVHLLPLITSLTDRKIGVSKENHKFLVKDKTLNCVLLIGDEDSP